MDLDTFKASLTEHAAPPGLSDVLRALWYDGKGEWEQAHEIVQDLGGPDGAWVHAYLHRKEGDLSNAACWYRQAGKPVANGSLAEEWERMVGAFFERT